ncbi:hypothetical protein [Streptomyces ruber]|nr:hypothetical protein [Streptomyces ruber]
MTHGTATATGTASRVNGEALYTDLVAHGELTNTGSECYSVWVGIKQDLTPAFPFKRATLCGEGTESVNLSVPNLMPTTTVYGYLCRGEQNTEDCSAPLRLV